jgi:uncharacterized membrane protein YphA (DoxX/SURF4 family)
MEIKNVGRILLGSLFVLAALNSLFFGFDKFAGMIELKGIPFPALIALMVLIFKLMAGLLIIFDNYGNDVITLLILFVTMTIILYHNVFIDKDQFNNMTKNIAIIGGLMLLYK